MLSRTLDEGQFGRQIQGLLSRLLPVARLVRPVLRSGLSTLTRSAKCPSSAKLSPGPVHERLTDVVLRAPHAHRKGNDS